MVSTTVIFRSSNFANFSKKKKTFSDLELFWRSARMLRNWRNWLFMMQCMASKIHTDFCSKFSRQLAVIVQIISCRNSFFLTSLIFFSFEGNCAIDIQGIIDFFCIGLCQINCKKSTDISLHQVIHIVRDAYSPLDVVFGAYTTVKYLIIQQYLKELLYLQPFRECFKIRRTRQYSTALTALKMNLKS